MRTDSLRHLFLAYLNLDWDLEYGTVEGAISDFLDVESEERVHEALAELDELIESRLDESTLKLMMTKIGCGYWPYGSGSTFQAWLPELRDAIESARSRIGDG